MHSGGRGATLYTLWYIYEEQEWISAHELHRSIFELIFLANTFGLKSPHTCARGENPVVTNLAVLRDRI